MAEIKVTMRELKRSLGELVNRAAYGREWVVLVAHGRPKAAIVSIEDLELLRRLRRGEASMRGTTRLEDLDALRERIRRRWEAEGIKPVDSADLIHEMREERTEDSGTRPGGASWPANRKSSGRNPPGIR